ncbi:MAG: ferrous iron transport protein B [Collinsella bouchesdurhonensis]|uniref:ferrous iron transport protein B n=1 Tax=Collinsella bouchesdurhonensis TaxID=1907654 RepID=UPI002EA73CE0|nr:ferrous iron transport protein B [Collinsella bouchesdurhonensis]
MKLDELEIGKDAIIASVASDDVALHQHILDMGLTPGTEVTMMKYAPMGDPMEIRLRGYELTLRRDTAARIELVDVHDTDTVARHAPQTGSVAHPALGEGYHPRRTKKAVPEGSPITFALAGNQNCGKTTLFNCLTGSNQHVGNFPGVTVDRKDGQIRNHPEATVTDLPGIYSLSPYTGEEVVSRQFILDSRPDAVIDIIDATNIERNLYLTLQLMELDRPMVIALNMMDEVTANGGTIDVNLLERELGVPVVPISAAKNEGIGELVEHAMHIARYGERPGRIDFCSSAADSPDGGALHRCIHGIANLIEDHAKAAAIPLRFAATKLVEGDALVIKALNLDQNELDAIEHIISQMEEESGSDRLCALADMRFTFIEDVCATCVVKPHESREHKRSVAIDRVLTGRFTAIPMFILIMGLVFWLTFGVIGAALQGLLEQLVSMVIGAADAGLTAFGTNPVVRSLVVNGVLTGVGSVLSFLPIIVVLFLLLSILEDSGYMARVAFVMDKILRRFGLSGRSFVPMLVGFGCSVPAIMSTRTLPSDHDRKMTVMLTPFMSCSAKLPVYGLLCAAFFPQATVPAMVSLYILGILVGMIVATILNHTVFKGEPVPFIMELPNYRMPSAKTTLLLAWDKAKGFITKAFTIIFAASVVIWFLQTFDIRFNMVTDQSQSMLAGLGGLIAPVFAPLGFGDWRTSTALVCGLIAKESVISTLTVLLGSTSAAALSGMFTAPIAYVFLVFVLLYPPCVAAISTVRSELGGRYAAAVFALQVTVAWIIAFVVHTVFLLAGLL